MNSEFNFSSLDYKSILFFFTILRYLLNIIGNFIFKKIISQSNGAFRIQWIKMTINHLFLRCPLHLLRCRLPSLLVETLEGLLDSSRSSIPESPLVTFSPNLLSEISVCSSDMDPT